MKRIPFLFALAVSLPAIGQFQRFQFTRPKLGSPFTLIFYATDSIRARYQAEACYHLVDSLNAVLSDYDANSEISRVAQKAGTGEWITVSPVLFELLQQSAGAWQKTGGAVDITIGPLSKLWRQARRWKRFPETKEVQTAKTGTGFQNLSIDEIHHRLKLEKPGMQLDFGAIAKGYIAQKVIEHLRHHSIDRALADAGGDIAMSGPPPGKQGWTVAVNLPESEELQPKKISIFNKAVATSGDLYQFIEKDGKKYSHIIDPATGYGVLHRRNVTVIAANGTQADWLATACSILPIRKAKKLIRRQKAALLVTEWKKGQLVVHSANGFEKYYEGK